MNLPSSLEIAKQDNSFWLLVASYFAIGTIILFKFVQPKTFAAALGLLGFAVLWNIL